jgi:hypothetical protein
MRYRRIMRACSWWVAWPVPSSAKYRRAVNWASMRFSQDESVGVQDPSALKLPITSRTRSSLVKATFAIAGTFIP